MCLKSLYDYKSLERCVLWEGKKPISGVPGFDLCELSYGKINFPWSHRRRRCITQLTSINATHKSLQTTK